MKTKNPTPKQSLNRTQTTRWVRALARALRRGEMLSDADGNRLAEVARGSDQYLSAAATEMLCEVVGKAKNHAFTKNLNRLKDAGTAHETAYEDLKSANGESLAESLANWNPTRQDFLPYAQARVGYAMSGVSSERPGYLKKGDWAAVAAGRLAREEFKYEHGREPSNEELEVATYERRVRQRMERAGRDISDPKARETAERAVNKEGGDKASEDLLGLLARTEPALRLDAPIAEDGSYYELLEAAQMAPSKWDLHEGEDLEARVADLLKKTKSGRKVGREAKQRALMDPLIQAAAFTFDVSSIEVVGASS